jgi:ribosomal protein S18 acetylase RimI-like enzyme
MSIKIRKATISDLPTIVDFMLKMAKETEDLILSSAILSPGIESGLNNSNKAEYFIAEIDGKIAGSLMITKEWSDWRNAWILWIQSVYTVRKYRKMGVYKALYNFIEKKVEESQEYCGIRLYVDSTNHTAIKVYTKLGMNGNHYKLFERMY